jgi:hypothetical protein
MDPLVLEAMEREAQSMGRECHLMESVIMNGDVVVVLYKPESSREGDDYREIRIAAYVDGKPKFSHIVS